MSGTYTIIGDQLVNLVQSSEGSINIDETGKATGKAIFTTRRANAVFLSQAVARHPDFPDLLTKTIDIEFQPPDFAKVTINFEGAVTGAPGSAGIVKTYSLVGATGADPIETHKDFATFGGTPPTDPGTANSHGATFNKKGAFEAFAVEPSPGDYYSSANTNLAGTKSYLAPSLIYTEIVTYNSLSRASGFSSTLPPLGKIDTPSASSLLPSVSSPYNWLLISFEISEIGEGIQTKKSWRLSGSRGWNSALYTA